jgi:hypothetical protein
MALFFEAKYLDNFPVKHNRTLLERDKSLKKGLNCKRKK